MKFNSSIGITNDDLIYRQSIIKLNSKVSAEAKKSYQGDGSRESIIEWGKQRIYKYPEEDEEIIPRNEWDLDKLIGETEYQLMHKDYYRAINHILEYKKKKQRKFN